MRSFEFEVQGTPKGKGRPRFSKVGGYVKTYTPKATHDYERLVAEAFLSQNGIIFDHPYLDVYITAYFPIPKSTKKSDKLSMSKGLIPYNHKPDVDNIAKSILDGLNGVAWNDDRQVVSLKVKKFYGVETKAIIRIKELNLDE